jgi:hypothetical protein
MALARVQYLTHTDVLFVFLFLNINVVASKPKVSDYEGFRNRQNNVNSFNYNFRM